MRLLEWFSSPLAPWLLLIGLGLLAGSFTGGYTIGRTNAINACEADKVAALKRLIAEQARLAEQDHEILSTHEAQQTRIRTVFQTIRQEANNYALVHRDDSCGLDADGLRIWRTANAGEAPAAAKPDHGKPGAAPAVLWPNAGPAFQSRRDGSALPRMQGAAPGAGGLGEE